MQKNGAARRRFFSPIADDSKRATMRLDAAAGFSLD
jgi:hypothetical protein